MPREERVPLPHGARYDAGAMNRSTNSPVIECPGVHRLAAMRDGAMARIRVPGGRLTTRAARTVADISERLGSGRIDLTNRANLQLRGLDGADLAPLHAGLADAGLMPRSEAADRLRNITASPLGGSALQDAVAGIDSALQAAADRLAGLPVKTSVVLDDGSGDVIGLGHDLGLVAMPDGGWRISLAGQPQDRAVGAADVYAFVLAVLAALARRRTRMSAWLANGDAEIIRTETVLAGTGVVLHAADAPPIHWPKPSADLGPVARDAIALQMPQDGLDARRLRALADMAEIGDGRLRLAPGRRVVLASLTSAGREAVAAQADAFGFETRRRAVHVVSCIGATGCARTDRDVRGDAARLATRLGDHDGPSATIHLTGCARGCAHPGIADWLLRGEGSGYALFADAHADASGRPAAHIAPDAVPERLAERLAERFAERPAERLSHHRAEAA